LQENALCFKINYWKTHYVLVELTWQDTHLHRLMLNSKSWLFRKFCVV
jgi:hypothetical protein